MGRRISVVGASAIIVLAVAAVVIVHEARSTVAAANGDRYGFLVNGGHLYLPYLYFQWTDTSGRLSGTRESLEPSEANTGYVAHRNRFTGTRSGDWLNITYLNGRYLRGIHERLHFVNNRLYVREGQTGVVWWAAGEAMTSSQWALTAIRFMECYTNPYEFGSPDRKCTNHG